MNLHEVPDTLQFESEVRSEQRNLALPLALAQRFTYHTVDEWCEHILKGNVTLNGALATAAMLVNTGDRICYFVRNYSEPAVPTHYEFLLAGKPAGIPVHKTGRIFWNTFASVLRRGTGHSELVPMHRLDRDTSGVMLFAKSIDTSARYQKNLTRILLRKIYLAVVHGDLSATFANELPQGTTRMEDGRFDVQIPLYEQKGKEGEPGAEVRAQMIPDFELGKPCRTLFRSLSSSVVECELCTGRKHQIRAHLAALGHPIKGDCIYSHHGFYYLKRCTQPLDAKDFEVLGASMQMLHAWKIELQLPYWREPRWFESKIMTEEMKRALEAPEGTKFR